MAGRDSFLATTHGSWSWCTSASLSQPGGLEGLAAIEVVPDLYNRPLVKRADRRSVRLHDDATSASPSDLVDEDDQLITGVDDLPGPPFEWLPGVVVAPKRFNAPRAAPEAASLIKTPARSMPLASGVEKVPQGRLEATPP